MCDRLYGNITMPLSAACRIDMEEKSMIYSIYYNNKMQSW